MEDRPVILVVDRNRRNVELLSQVLNRRGYRSLSAATVEELDDALENSGAISLALIDLGGFDQSIWLRCEMMRQASIPCLIISPPQLPIAQRTGLQLGARGVVVKPLAADELLGLINAMLGK